MRPVALRLEPAGRDAVALGGVRQPPLVVVARCLRLVAALLVRGEEAAERDHCPRGAELDAQADRRLSGDPQRDRLTLCVLHLRGDGAHPDQFVQPELVTAQPRLGRRAEPVAGRTDRLVRLLRVLDLALVDARLLREVFVTEQLAYLRPRRADCGLGEGDGVGTHVGDVTVLVQPLGHLHGAGRAVAELAGGLLLQRGRGERRRRILAALAALDVGDRECLASPQIGEDAIGLGLGVMKSFLQHLCLQVHCGSLLA